MKGSTAPQDFKGMSDDDIRQQLQNANARADEIRMKHMQKPKPKWVRTQSEQPHVSDSLLRPRIGFANLLGRLN